MDVVHESLTIELGDGHLTVPIKSLLAIWMKTHLGPPAPAQYQPIEPPRIGTMWAAQGGVYAGVMRGEDGAPDYHLIVPTDAAAYTKEIAWGAAGVDEPGATSEYDGFANTVALMQSERSHPAAEWAADLEIGERCDFYLPSRRELRLMWTNVPELFETGDWYWSSTQYAGLPFNAWFQIFDDGFQYGFIKSYAGRARAVRRLVIQ
jgi:hypothetical protein